MSGSSVDLLGMLNNLPADQVAEIGKLIDRAEKKVSDSSKISAQVDLHIDVSDSNTPDPKELHAALSKASGGQSPPLTENDLVELQKAQPALLKWIGTSKENAAFFAANPIRALGKSAIPIEKNLLAKLQDLNRGFQGFTTIGGIPIRSVVLEAKPSFEAPPEKKQQTPNQPSTKDDKRDDKKDDKKGGK